MHFEDRYNQEAQQVRLWMLVPKKKDAYLPGFEGTFLEAMADATNASAFWQTPYEVWEADPEKYRREGGLKALWATVSVPKGSPLRIPVILPTRGER